MNDDIGGRGEAILVVLLTDFSEVQKPLFRAHFLGEKAVTVDHFVEVLGADPGRPFFFAQVRATTRGYTKRGRRLRVSVSQRDVNRLVAYPAPTYVIGIDARERSGYILSVNEPRKAISSLSTEFPLTPGNLTRLWAEVRDYWGSRDMTLKDSAFKEKG